MSVELYECKPLAARITVAQCEKNRSRQTNLLTGVPKMFACQGCAGLGEAVPTPEVTPPAPVQLKRKYTRRLDQKPAYVWREPKPAAEVVPTVSRELVLRFESDEDALVFDALADLARRDGTVLADDVLAILHWFVQDFSLGQEAA